MIRQQTVKNHISRTCVTREVLIFALSLIMKNHTKP